MHAIHNTTGFIVGSKPYGEAGKLISIFTRDFGLVMAAAQGIRLERSKLRYSTQDYSLGSFSLVRGKELWRLTSAAAGVPAAALELTARIALLLRRLLQGEEAHPELFECVEASLSFLARNTDLNDEQLNTIESITVLQILNALGYVAVDSELEAYLKPGCLDVSGLVSEAVGKRTNMNKHINKALKESHL